MDAVHVEPGHRVQQDQQGLQELLRGAHGVAASGHAKPKLCPRLRGRDTCLPLSYLVTKPFIHLSGADWSARLQAVVFGVAGVAVTPAAVATPGLEGAQTYVVESGDTLWDIAQRFGTTVEALVEANGLEEAADLTVGQQLIIPESGQ